MTTTYKGNDKSFIILTKYEAAKLITYLTSQLVDLPLDDSEECGYSMGEAGGKVVVMVERK